MAGTHTDLAPSMHFNRPDCFHVQRSLILKSDHEGGTGQAPGGQTGLVAPVGEGPEPATAQGVASCPSTWQEDPSGGLGRHLPWVHFKGVGGLQHRCEIAHHCPWTFFLCRSDLSQASTGPTFSLCTRRWRSFLPSGVLATG